jgi:hypothetical protein
MTVSNPNTSNLYWVFLDDQTDQWPTFANDDKRDCAAKWQWAANRSPAQVRSVTSTPKREGFIDKYRPHVWYVVLSNCGGAKTDVEYTITMLNDDDSWNAQFSWDEQG